METQLRQMKGRLGDTADWRIANQTVNNENIKRVIRNPKPHKSPEPDWIYVDLLQQSLDSRI